MKWVDIPGFEGRYAASDQGDIMSLSGRRAGRRPSGAVQGGYRVVTLMLPDRGYRKFYAHRLVCLAFHGTPPAGRPLACHGNGDRLDNRASNLRWGSYTENLSDAVQHGHRPTGTSHWSSKLSDGDLRQIRALFAEGVTQTEIARRFGIHQTTVSLIRLGRRYCDSCDARVEAPMPGVNC